MLTASMVLSFSFGIQNNLCDRLHLSDWNNFPAMLNRRSAGSDEAVIDKYLDKFEQRGVFWSGDSDRKQIGQHLLAFMVWKGWASATYYPHS